MKEAIGGVSLFQIVVLFLLLFTGVMCLTINHSKAFGVKDEIINILETDAPSSSNKNSYKLSNTTVEKIVDYLTKSGHRITGNCPSDDWIGYNRNGEEVKNNASFCIKTTDVSKAYYDDLVNKCKKSKCSTTSDDFPKMAYYDVIVFYQLDIPIIKQIMNFKLYGSTKVLFRQGV